jgi:hypothetical protein
MPADASRDHLSPEAPDVAARPVLAYVFGFLALILAGAAAMYAYYIFKVTGPLIANPRVFPQPHLQTAPHTDLQRLLAAQRKTLSTYSWADPAQQTVRIPIERAMQLIVARGEHALHSLTTPPATPTPGSRGADPR